MPENRRLAEQARASWRRSRACSGLTTRLILSYVEREAGRPGVEELLRLRGLTGREAELRDESRWFTFEEKVGLFEAAVTVTRDDRVAERIGESALEFSIGLAIKRALRALGSPDFVYRNVARANSKFNWAHEMEMVVSEPGHLRLSYRDVSGVGYHPYDCQYTTGLLRTVPQLFGYPAARVSHQFCGATGADHCQFDVQWVGGIRANTRPLLLAGASGVVFAGTGAFVDPVLMAIGAALAAGSAAIAAVQATLFMRGRIGALETRVRDQDLQVEAQLASLAALSSELRLDEVLDAITTSASTAVGGAEFALLIAEAGRMRADRHSGLSPDSLWRLERWAQDSEQLLTEGPIVIDDLGSVASLAELTIETELPVGSACAAPLLFKDRLLGALVALAPGANVFLPQDVRALSACASHAAIALSNARLVEQLEREASEDPLTGLANKRSFVVAYSAELNRAARDGTSTAIVTLDIDHFKQINDRYHHSFGDQVLIAVAGAVRGAVREYDTVARVGGDEFVILLPGATVEEAETVAERARALISEIELPEGELSCSAGVAAVLGGDVVGEGVLDAADAALYEAKRQGRNRIRLARLSG
ncbi:MAG TPA: sensor domain-containing diguanylate cyclase [Solirubrobacteraceae bacterium]|nr:sensor domain-containing diguanylate cyclase [Solirubrobacteraceae bacterium]